MTIHSVECIHMILVMLKVLVQSSSNEYDKLVETAISVILYIWQNSTEFHEAVKKVEILDQFTSLLFTSSKETDEEAVRKNFFSIF